MGADSGVLEPARGGRRGARGVAAGRWRRGARGVAAGRWRRARAVDRGKEERRTGWVRDLGFGLSSTVFTWPTNLT
jgi:hypothetical protein